MKGQGGFTVVETTLAMAISTATVALTIGLTITAGNKRFQNTMNEVRSFVQTQYDEVRSSINSRLGGKTLNLPTGSSCANDGSSSAAGNSKCYIIGRLLQFNNGSDKVSSKYIVAVPTAANWPDVKKSAIYNLKNGVRLFAIDSASFGAHGGDSGVDPMTRAMASGSSIKAARNLAGSGGSVSASNQSDLVIIHSPQDSSILTLMQVSSDSLGLLHINDSTDNSNLTKAIIIANGGVGFSNGLLCVRGGDNATNVAINYNAYNVNDNREVLNQCNNLWWSEK